MWKQGPQFFVPMRTSEVMSLIFQNYSSVLQNDLPNDADTPKTGISVLNDITQEKGKKTRRPKTEQRLERDRVKQRLSRIRKRAQKKAGLVVEDSDGPEKQAVAA
jgi:hypothetical protein